ncbi:MAG: thiamine phosphate synthase [Candidatus Omnitrophota bacterium]|nr:thiamine phosphate synthase [Candidatus Omnitrophota bacterium]
MSKPSIRDAKLYVIVDRFALGGRDPVEVAAAAARGGADVIQWRDKQAPDGEFLETARRLREQTRRQGVLFIVNDRVAAALGSQADGVHVGHEDLSVPEVRARVGDSMLIGRSTHSLEEALEAQRQGADYIGVGPVFATPTKPGYPPVGLKLVAQVRGKIRIPWVAIGGIDLENAGLVSSAGAACVAVVRAVAAAPDPEAAARSLKGKLSSS